MSDYKPRVIGQYRRSKDGKTIHLEPCPTKGGVPWMREPTAQITLHMVVETVRAHEWLRLCRRCWPADALNAAEPKP